MEHPRHLRAGHYFLAMQGAAMLRDFLQDPAALVPRAEEICRIVETLDEFPNSLDVPVTRYDVEQGYTLWAPVYDGPNPAIEAEEPVLAELLDRLDPSGRTALDAACGTGRQAATLAARGWTVIGVDRTQAMLDIAEAKVPDGSFHLGPLTDLPLDDESVDLVVCSLALTHVDELGPVFAEFARVLRPGGTVITTDLHPMSTTRGSMAVFPVADDSPDAPPLAVHYVPNLVHHTGAYVRAFVDAGLSIESCLEPEITDRAIQGFPSHAIYPEATRRAVEGLPYLLVWQARKPSPNAFGLSVR